MFSRIHILRQLWLYIYFFFTNSITKFHDWWFFWKKIFLSFHFSLGIVHISRNLSIHSRLAIFGIWIFHKIPYNNYFLCSMSCNFFLPDIVYFDPVSSPWSVQFSHSVVSDSLWPHGLQYSRLPCPSPTPRACSNSYPSSRWCHQTISPYVVPFFLCLLTFPVSENFPMSQFFPLGGQSIGVLALASVLPMYIQDWFPLGLSGLIPWQSKEISRVFSNTTVQKHQFFGAQLPL